MLICGCYIKCWVILILTLLQCLLGECRVVSFVYGIIWFLVSILCNEYYVAVEGIWILNDIKIMWIAVYAPQSLSSKIALWSSLANLIANWDGILVAMGDFNEVWEAGKRFGSHFNERRDEIFNTFISNASLIDVPLGGYKFTWTDK